MRRDQGSEYTFFQQRVSSSGARSGGHLPARQAPERCAESTTRPDVPIQMLMIAGEVYIRVMAGLAPPKTLLGPAGF
ncbi:MAG: hypothetical protein JO110_30560 [Acetobacteraceae bacterium]|nr:hypothetical protein [Acetobacteraceae bacterium]